jgi:membrane-bound serine protease (ClpP class)
VGKTPILALIVFLFFQTNPVYPQDENPPRKVYIIPVKGTIDLGLAGFIGRALKEAKSEKANAVILEIDTFGGRVDAALEICKYLEDIEPISTVAFINDQAWSAGALISLACKSIVMSPGSSIGSAEPRTMGFMQKDELADEKTVSAVRAKFKSIAQTNNHSSALALAMVDKDLEVLKVGLKGKMELLTSAELEEKKVQYPDEEIVVYKTVSPAGKLLNLSAQDAKELGLAVAVASDLKETFSHLNLGGPQIVRLTPNWSENLVRFLTHPILSSLLLSLGFLGILFELKIPGWGISGTLGLLALALFFWGHYLIGLANWTEIILFLAGVALLAIEVFLIPGFGLSGGLGIILILSGIYLALIKHPFGIPGVRLINAFYTIALAFILTFLIGILSIKWFPHSGLWKRLVLDEGELRELGFGVGSAELEKLLGKTGRTLTTLRPAGKARFGQDILDVITEGDFVESNQEIKVIKIEGNKIIVERV